MLSCKTWKRFFSTLKERNDGDVAIKPFGEEIFEKNYFIKQTPIFNIQIDSLLQYIFIPIEDLEVPA